MKLKVKLISDKALLPIYATEGAAAFDITATNAGIVPACDSEIFSTGLAFEIPQGYYLEVVSRSGHGFKNGVRLANSVGVIDSDYRGELKVKLHNDSNVPYSVKSGERIAQAIMKKYEKADFYIVDNLGETSRGQCGFGSTGK